ncbi:choline oxidase [Rathayibacter sp. VKM Ac-2803]|uniref:GMC family oxidoreductase n=1 Tax=Rathayibacter sp. VKM Ac-2803 TaxID=2609256 RepID=UPI00135BC8C2|nr:GMC oxidoreductase [Rathayibacter sp. VKM Ac-2803]MWV48529.1 choline oxidase [Rathayibacter sp. VKM Ac-2803]
MAYDTPDLVDVLVLGGGTAGIIVASRLSEDPSLSVGLVEAGPSDADEPRANSIRRWAEMLEGEYDLDYRSVPNARGNSFIRQSRLRILGGCSTANTMITWRPLRGDMDEWVSLGADGWDYETMSATYDRLLAPVTPIPPEDRNPYLQGVIDAAVSALGVDEKPSWNDHEFVQGAGYFEIGYDPATNQRSSASHSYLRLHGAEHRPNLHITLDGLVVRVIVEDGRAVGALVRTPDGVRELRARREVVLSCGAIDSPALLQRSGIGPRAVLEAAGVPVHVDLPGVGENLQDHAEGLVVWEARTERPPISATGWDAGYVIAIDPDSTLPDVSTHIPLETWGVHAERAGFTLPEGSISLVPNVAKPRSRGRVWITSADPDAAPSIDYNSFSDPAGRDERMLVAGARRARMVAQHEPLASLIVREVFPGPDAQTDEELSAALRATHQTVYHVSCTARMGADADPLAVLDPRLRVRGVTGLRVVDASSFPTIPALNPVGVVMTLAERAAELIRDDLAAPPTG